VHGTRKKEEAKFNTPSKKTPGKGTLSSIKKDPNEPNQMESLQMEEVKNGGEGEEVA
jgi:hypothetical protein